MSGERFACSHVVGKQVRLSSVRSDMFIDLVLEELT